MKGRILALMLGLTVLLTGCGRVLPYAREMGDMALMRVMGVDGEEDGLSVTVSTGKRASGLQNEEEGALILSLQGKSLSTVCQAMQGASESYVFYGYVDQLLLGEDMARQGVYPVLDYFSRDTQLGLGAQLWLVRGDRAESAVRSGGEEGIDARLSTLQTDSRMGTAGVTRTAGEAFTDLLERGSAYVPVLEVTSDDQGETALMEGGYGVLKDGVLAGFLTGEQAKGLELLESRAAGDLLEVTLPSGLVVVRVNWSGLTVEPETEGDGLTGARLTCLLAAELVEFSQELTGEEQEQVRTALEDRERRRLQQALAALQGWGTDCVNLGGRIAVSEPGRWSRAEEDWPEVFSQLELQVEVQANLTYFS